MRSRVWVLGLVLGASMSGCAEGASDRPAYSTGIAATERSVATLDDSQLEQVCESYDVYVETYVDFETIAYVACLPAALVLSQTRQECDARLSGCMALFPEPIQVSGTVRSQELCVQDLQQCTATVAELESCVNVNLDSFLDISAWSCDLIGDAEVTAQARQSMDTVRVCESLDDACNRFAMVKAPE